MMFFIIHNAYKSMIINMAYPRKHTAQRVFDWMDRRYKRAMRLSVFDMW